MNGLTAGRPAEGCGDGARRAQEPAKKENCVLKGRKVCLSTTGEWPAALLFELSQTATDAPASLRSHSDR